MSSLLSKPLAAIALAFAASALCASGAAHAVEQKPAAVKKKSGKKNAEPAAEQGQDADEPDISGATAVEYKCELGNTLTIYENSSDTATIALRWKKKLIRLTRVGTTTGALRFENPLRGLVWIGIPTKGILLDSKLGRQLANNCKNPEQASQG
ncbi:hypothetical protein [Pseudoduganella sp. GCM10020061]|uniref:hypothetical protein n=1 Tax=Pseudoduganella sp. GCM10020061 TaxID=3317345 RepID=UPI003640277F